MERSIEKRSVTMQDVANHVGCTPMTVSRVLNGTGRISPATRDAVQKAMDELGYRPHLAPKMMREGRSRQVGVLLENRPERRFTHPLTYEFILGINEGLEAGGHIMSMVRVSEVEEGANWNETALQSRLLDGLIVVNYLPTTTQEKLQSVNLPCVWLDANIWEKRGCVRRDEVGAARLTIEKIAELGFKNAVVFATSSSEDGAHYSAIERNRGVESAAFELGISLQRRFVEWPTPDTPFQDAIAFSCQRILREIAPQTALIVRDTYLAQALLIEAAQSEKVIGCDVHLVCIDDHFHEESYHWRDISRVSFDRFEMGKRAAQMLLESLEGGVLPPSETLGGEFVAGKTLCAPITSV